MASAPPAPRIHWFARLEHRLHVWREGRARRRGRAATILPFPGYGGPGWVRVVGRVLIVPPQRRTREGEPASVRGWRSFVGIPVGFAAVSVHFGGTTHQVAADRGGIGSHDLFIAAHARSRGMTLLTRKLRSTTWMVRVNMPIAGILSDAGA